MSPVCWGCRGHPWGEEEGEVPTVPAELSECRALLHGAAPVRPLCRARSWALGAEAVGASQIPAPEPLGGLPREGRSPQCSPCPLAGPGAALSGMLWMQEGWRGSWRRPLAAAHAKCPQCGEPQEPSLMPPSYSNAFISLEKPGKGFLQPLLVF